MPWDSILIILLLLYSAIATRYGDTRSKKHTICSVYSMMPKFFGYRKKYIICKVSLPKSVCTGERHSSMYMDFPFPVENKCLSSSKHCKHFILSFEFWFFIHVDRNCSNLVNCDNKIIQISWYSFLFFA